ncbi:(2Fe-2S)-binding protein [Rhodovastum atsumiense]|uniref:(2Fe-2S)-binding protein n=1 Tax=Rhodovastum atsumiense TaxID=504468 RepID=A0A5M6INX7_9PROT|nr:(2Fe-2S)-binding protein [Rhodovastum atsumiense]KAA5609973.1 (2Fe-2S)-binding protein [Rhodovastum atsumiense]CAH2598613.1 (2Fe-2S)-binding protein [Rhodovastum atsumiense]
MFKRLDPAQATLRFTFEGQSIAARPGETVAAALLAAGIGVFRETPVSGAPRAPHCMMGVCFDCLVEIDGVANRQSCQTPVAEGMQVRRQHGARGLA